VRQSSETRASFGRKVEKTSHYGSVVPAVEPYSPAITCATDRGNGVQKKGIYSPGAPGRLSGLNVFHRTCSLCGDFVWAGGALNSPFRRFAARTVQHNGINAIGTTGGAGMFGERYKLPFNRTQVRHLRAAHRSNLD
jgi:hypothetical protein